MSTLADRIAQANRQRLIEAAHRYAAADKSDPFAFARAVTHVNRGLCRPGQDGRPAHYDAEPYQEMRKLPDGTEYAATVYRNLVRP